MGFEGQGDGVASVTLPPPPSPPPPFSIMTGAQLTFLCTIWDQIALFQPAVSLRYAFNPVKHFYHVHGNPGFALHQLQQIYNGILYSEIRKRLLVIYLKLILFIQHKAVFSVRRSKEWLWLTMIRWLDLCAVDKLRTYSKDSVFLIVIGCCSFLKTST